MLCSDYVLTLVYLDRERSAATSGGPNLEGLTQ